MQLNVQPLQIYTVQFFIWIVISRNGTEFMDHTTCSFDLRNGFKNCLLFTDSHCIFNEQTLSSHFMGSPFMPQYVRRGIIKELREALLSLYASHNYFAIWLKDELFPHQSTVADIAKLKPRHIEQKLCRLLEKAQNMSQDVWSSSLSTGVPCADGTKEVQAAQKLFYARKKLKMTRAEVSMLFCCIWNFTWHEEIAKLLQDVHVTDEGLLICPRLDLT